jgi:hypothetical protein
MYIKIQILPHIQFDPIVDSMKFGLEKSYRENGFSSAMAFF